MGSDADNADVKVMLDGATGEACLHLDLSIIIPRENFLELATLMYEERYIEAEQLVNSLRPDAAEYTNLFFGKRLRRVSRPSRTKKAA